MPRANNAQRSCGSLIVLTAIVASLLIIASTSGQDIDPTTAQPQPQASSSRAITLKGELGLFGEAYRISDHEARRPSSTGRIFLRSTFTAWNSASASLNFMLSNEGSSARQDINQLDFNPRWRWGEAHAGDFVEELSPLTLSGIRVRGGGIMLTPGPWRLSLISGMTTRSVEAEGGSRAYERSITGIKLGYGRSGGFSIDLNVLNARDRLNSIADAEVDTTATDTAAVDYEQNPVSIAPQENLVISTATNLVMFQGKLKWRNEFGASGITRDRRSAELDNSDVPEFLTNLFMPRKSSGADFAYTGDMNLDFKKVSFMAGLHYIGPGYVSLGLASQTSDKQEIVAGTTWRFHGGQIRLDGALQRDNLIHQKTYTTDRKRITTFVTYRLNQNWNATGGVAYVGMANDASSDTSRLDYSSWILRTGQYFTFGRQVGLKSISVDYTYQKASDGNPLRRNSGTNSNSVTLAAPVGLSSSLDLVPTLGLISVRVGEGNKNLTQTYSLSARHTALQRKLTSSAAIAVSVADVTTTLRPSVRSNYELGNNFSLTAEGESTMVKGGAPSSRFDELTGRLILTRRF